MSDSNSSSVSAPKSGNLSVTLSTWLFILDASGHAAAEGEVADRLAALRDAAPGEADHAARKLADAIDDAVGDDPDFERVVAWLRSLYGDGAVRTSFGEDRQTRLQQARAHQFRSSLPWIARIIDRFPDGSVGAHWVMVERITDKVTCMDPYPWDDLDEEYEQPVVEFQVKWELAGSNCIAWASKG